MCFNGFVVRIHCRRLTGSRVQMDIPITVRRHRRRAIAEDAQARQISRFHRRIAHRHHQHGRHRDGRGDRI